MKTFFGILMAIAHLLTGCATSENIEKTAAEAEEEEPSPLEDQQWMVVKIGEDDVLADTTPHLLFLPGGRIAGSATCNRIIGDYELKGEDRISVSPVGTTMMACPEEQMKQEQKLLDLLPKLESFELTDSGTLYLRTKEGTTIVTEAK